MKSINFWLYIYVFCFFYIGNGYFYIIMFFFYFILFQVLQNMQKLCDDDSEIFIEFNMFDSGRGGSESDVQIGCIMIILKFRNLGMK